MRRLGVHTSIAGGIHKSLIRANKLGCTTMQIFSHNPRGWAVKEISKEDRALFKKLRQELDISPVYVHTSYLINMASPSEELIEKSAYLLREEMERADAIGADFVVLHTGSAADSDKKAARRRAIKALQEVFKDGPWNAGLLLENTAGEREDITSEVIELAEIITEMNGLITGVCIDTCHAFQAGYNIKIHEGIKRLAREIEKYIGKDAVKLIHLNDSKIGFGSHRDRHEHIGTGQIGVEGLRQFITNETFSSIPLILETPKKAEADDIKNLNRVRRLLNPPKNRHRKLSLRAKRSNLVFCDEIATNPLGSRNDR